MPVAFDARQTILSRKKKEFLEKIYSEFAEDLSKTLHNYISLPVKVMEKSVTYFSYENYLKTIQSPSLNNLFGIEPVDSHGLLRMDNSLVLIAIDRILGGPGSSSGKKEKLSLIELKMSEAFINQILNRLNTTLETFVECTFHLQTMVQDLSEMKFGKPEDPVIVVQFDLMMGEQQGTMDVCFPIAFLGPVLVHIDKQEKQSFGNLNDPKIVHIAKEKMSHVAVPVTAYLGELNLSLRDLSSIEIGHVICLGRVENGLVVKVGQLPVFIGQPGIANDNLGVKILKEVPIEK